MEISPKVRDFGISRGGSYQSTFPAHLERAFRGHASMRENWTCNFDSVPDIKAELLRSCSSGDTVWAEWEWKGTRADGAPFVHAGVTIQGVRQGRIAWVRLYMEAVQEASPSLRASLNGETG